MSNITKFKNININNNNNNNITKNIFEFDGYEIMNLINPKKKDMEKSSESFYKEDKFFVTRSNINKNTSININKIFFPEKYKKKSEKEKEKKINEESFKNKFNEIKINSNETFNIDIHTHTPQKNLKKSKIYPINFKTISERKEFPQVKNNLTQSLNKELSRISIVYGNNNSMKKFTENPIADKHYENNDYYAYEIAKQKEFQKVNFKPKLKPLNIKEPLLFMMSKNIFSLKDMKKTIRKIY
jgi:hypothetical protein